MGPECETKIMVVACKPMNRFNTVPPFFPLLLQGENVDRVFFVMPLLPPFISPRIRPRSCLFAVHGVSVSIFLYPCIYPAPSPYSTLPAGPCVSFQHLIVPHFLGNLSLSRDLVLYVRFENLTPEPRLNSSFYSAGYSVQNRKKTSTFPIGMTCTIASFHRASRSSHSAIFIRRVERYSVPPFLVRRSGTRGNRKLQVNEPYAVTRFSLGRVLRAAGPLVRGPLRSLSRDTRVFPCWIQPSSLPYTSAEGRRNRV